jgi:MFS family permease
VLAVSVLGSGIAALDATVVNIALPAIGRDFGTGVAALQWVMNGYTLTLAAFLLIGGSLGDRFGRRKVYLIGTVWFALASAACGFAPNVVFLIFTRVLQGVGAALLTPGSLAILEASFRPRRPRPGDRRLVGPGRYRCRRRAAGRRLPHLSCFLAVDLLHQHPGRGDGDRAGRTARPRIAQPRCGRPN